MVSIPAALHKDDNSKSNCQQSTNAQAQTPSGGNLCGFCVWMPFQTPRATSECCCLLQSSDSALSKTEGEEKRTRCAGCNKSLTECTPELHRSFQARTSPSRSIMLPPSSCRSGQREGSASAVMRDGVMGGDSLLLLCRFNNA